MREKSGGKGKEDRNKNQGRCTVKDKRASVGYIEVSNFLRLDNRPILHDQLFIP